MPRRLPVRPAKIIGNLFVLFVLIVIGLIYYAYVGLVWGPRVVGKYYSLLIPQSIRKYPCNGTPCFLPLLLHTDAMVIFLINDY